MLPRRGRSRQLRTDEAASPSSLDTDRGLWTVPNLISALRIAAIPLFLWVLLGRDNPGLAAVMLGVIAWTDYLDGWLARKLDQVSEIGKFLDPLADRLVVASSVIGGLAAGVVPPWLGWPLLAREAAIGAVALYLLVTLRIKVAVRQLGKAATVFVFCAVPFYYLAHTGFFPGFWQLLGAATGVTGLILYLIVSWQYAGDMRRSVQQHRARRSDG